MLVLNRVTHQQSFCTPTSTYLLLIIVGAALIFECSDKQINILISCVCARVRLCACLGREEPGERAVVIHAAFSGEG